MYIYIHTTNYFYDVTLLCGTLQFPLCADANEKHVPPESRSCAYQCSSVPYWQLPVVRQLRNDNFLT